MGEVLAPDLNDLTAVCEMRIFVCRYDAYREVPDADSVQIASEKNWCVIAGNFDEAVAAIKQRFAKEVHPVCLYIESVQNVGYVSDVSPTAMQAFAREGSGLR